MFPPAAVLAIVVVVALLPAIAFALAPSPPTALNAVAGPEDPAIAVLDWSAPSGGAVASYRVFVSTIADGGYRFVGDTTETTFTFIDGFGGVEYYFRVTAVNTDGEESTPAQAGPVVAEWMASPHAFAETTTRTCRKCHAVHEGESTLILRTEIATDTPGQTATCFACHDGRSTEAANVATGPEDSFALSSGHSLDDAFTGDLTTECSSCHGEHQASSSSPMLPQGKTGTGPAWCFECHSSNAWFEGTYPDPEVPDRNASGYPIAGTWLGPDAYSGAGNAHRLIPETTQTAGDGGNVRRSEGDCLYCHSAHRGANEYDALRTTFRPTDSSTLALDQTNGTYALVCFTCHGGVAPSGFATAPVNIKQFATSGSPGAGHKITAGHRIRTSGGDLPVGAPLPCYECHNPHGTTRGNDSMLSDTLGGGLGTGAAQDTRTFCLTCHTTSDTGAGWDSETATYTAVPAAEEVVGISRTGGALGLPNVPGHAEADTEDCYTCHGDSYVAGGNNVHNPDVGAAPDNRAPTTISDALVSYTDSATISLTATDNAGGSGVATTYYALDGGVPVAGTSVTVSTLGNHTLEFWSVDVVGNIETPFNSVAFTIAAADTIAPTTTSDALASYTESATISITATDNAGGTGVATTYYSLDGGIPVAGTSVTVSTLGAHTLEYWSVDAAGNEEMPHNLLGFTITAAVTDTIAPTTISDALVSYTDSATISLTATDNAGGSGVATTYYALDGGVPVAGTSVTVSTLGNHTLEFWSVDVVGNIETPFNSVAFTIAAADTIAPTTTSDALASYTESATISITATDNAGGTGVATTYYSLDGGIPVAGTSVTVSTLGAHTLEYWSVDAAGNEEMPHNLLGFTITAAVTDTIAPTTISDALVSYTDSATISLTATDNAGGSGVATTYYALDGGVPVAGTSVTVSTLGNHTLEFWSVDVVGNIETPFNSVAFTIAAADTIAPTTTSDALASYTESATISITATDNAGGTGVATTYYSLDGGIPVAGTSVTVSTLGAHTLEYWSVDAAGNEEMPHNLLGFTITAAVTDTIAPTTISDALVSYTDSATISLTATDNAGGSGVATTYYALDGGVPVAGTSVTVSTLGNHTLEFWSVDVVGNIETPFNSVAFTIAAADTIAPTTTSDALFAYVNSATITLTALDNPGGSGVADTYYVLDGGVPTAGTSITVSTLGAHTLEFWSVDVAGNEETPHTTANFSITDSIAPTTTSDAVAGYTDSASIALSATDNPGGSGVATTYYILDGGALTAGTSVTVSASGSHTLEFWSVDVAGNVETPSNSVSFTITDSIAPTTTSNAVVSYTGSATITLSATDNVGGSGVATTYYILDGGAQTAGTSVTVSASGAHSLEFWSVDVAGNVETPHTTVNFSITAADTTAPTTTSDAQPLYTSAATVSLSATDNVGGSGVATTYYILDGGAQTAGTSVTVSASGAHSLEFWSVDVAGNVETPHTTVNFTVDSVSPTTTSNAVATYNNSATISLTATDNVGGTGVATTYYILDGGAQTAGTSVTVSTLGAHTLEFWSVDVAGNVETPHKIASFTVTDSIAPTTTSNAVATYNNSATITLSATDNGGGSGVATTYYRVDGGTQTAGTSVTVSTSGSHTLEFWSVDVAGNVETPRNSADFTVNDTVAPATASDALLAYVELRHDHPHSPRQPRRLGRGDDLLQPRRRRADRGHKRHGLYSRQPHARVLVGRRGRQ